MGVTFIRISFKNLQNISGVFLDVSSLFKGLLSMEFVTETPNLLERNKQIQGRYLILQESWQFTRLWVFFLPIAIIPLCNLLYNPSFHDFLRFVKGSLEISAGYSPGMSWPVNDPYAVWVFTGMGIFIAIMITCIILRDYNNFLIMLWLSPCLFMAYKHGYVRADVHVIWGRNF